MSFNSFYKVIAFEDCIWDETYAVRFWVCQTFSNRTFLVFWNLIWKDRKAFLQIQLESDLKFPATFDTFSRWRILPRKGLTFVWLRRSYNMEIEAIAANSVFQTHCTCNGKFVKLKFSTFKPKLETYLLKTKALFAKNA